MESTKCCRRAPDRGALTSEAGNASRRQVMVVASAWRTPDKSGPNISRVMRTNFGNTTAKIFREYSDSLIEKTVLEEGEIFLGLIDRMEQEKG